MRPRRKGRILIALASVGVFASLAAYGTYALFTQTANVENHIASGKLDVGLNRVEYQEHILDSKTGKMVTSEIDKTVVDLKESKDVVFDMQNTVPTSWYESTIQIVNNGTVAIDYDVEIFFDSENATELQNEFAKQIEINISNDNEVNETFKLSEAAGKKISLNTLALDDIPDNVDAQTFKVKASFINDDENNNKVQAIDLKFDLKVNAVQSTAE